MPYQKYQGLAIVVRWFVYSKPTFWVSKMFYTGIFVKFLPYIQLLFKSGLESKVGYDELTKILVDDFVWRETFINLRWKEIIKYTDKDFKRLVETNDSLYAPV